MNVDLPAPLSPSTHVTWPALTTVETSFSAMTLPKYLPMPLTSSSGLPFVALMTGSLPRAAGRTC